MKNQKFVKVIATVLVVLFFSNIFAQKAHGNVVPDAVLTAMVKKYPNAKVKKWKLTNSAYTADAVIDKNECRATFDQNGNWVNTTSKIRWEWSLPATIRTAYKKTKYSNWNIYLSKKLERPDGEFYQLMVDNSNLIDHFPNPVLIATETLLEFKANGELISAKDISADPAPKV